MKFLTYGFAFIVVAVANRGFLSAETPQVQADKSEVGKLPFSKSVDVTLPTKSVFLDASGSYRVVADFGGLPRGQEGEIRVFIKNPEDFDIPIKSAAASCGCTRAELKDAVIKAGQDSELYIKIKTPAKNKSPEFKSSIKLMIDSSKCEEEKLTHITVELRYRVEGLLCFVDHLVTSTVDSGRDGELRLPLVETLATPVSSVQLETEGALEGVEGQLVSNDELTEIRVLISPSMASTRGEFGRIKVTDPVSNVTDSVDVILYTQPRISVSPRVVRFTKAAKGDEYVANCILRLNSVTDPKGGPDDGKPRQKPEDKRDGKLKLAPEASLAGIKLRADFTPMNARVGRLQMFLSSDAWDSLTDEEKGDAKLRWRFMTEKMSVSGNSPISILD